ncbi:MAG: DUF4266 domain-containing protein [Proteobacteria bacterium]|nr:DUF4266 domain-containing protein [Pseudomonadota bacterium]
MTSPISCRLLKLSIALAVVGTACLSTGCTSVAAWERGNLAKPIMAADPLPLQSSLRVHIYASREAAGAATFGAAGGGCGCN